MSKLHKAIGVILAFLLVGLITHKEIKAENLNVTAEAVATWNHNGSTGTSASVVCSRPCVIYGVSIGTFTAVSTPASILFYSTNTSVGNAISKAEPLWTVAVNSDVVSGIGANSAIPPMPIRAGKGAALEVTDGDLNFQVYYKYSAP